MSNTVTARRFTRHLLGKQAIWPFGRRSGIDKDQVRRRLQQQREELAPAMRLARQMAQLSVAGRDWWPDDQEALFGAARKRKVLLHPAAHEEELFAQLFPESLDYAADTGGPVSLSFSLWPDPYAEGRKWLSRPLSGGLEDLRSVGTESLFRHALERYTQQRGIDTQALLDLYLQNVSQPALQMVGGKEIADKVKEKEQRKGKKDRKKEDKDKKDEGEKEHSGRRKAALDIRTVPSQLEEDFYPDQRLGKRLDLLRTPQVAYRKIDEDALRLLRRILDRTGGDVPLDVYNEAVEKLPSYRKRRWLLTALLLAGGPLLGAALGGPLGAAAGLAGGAGLSGLVHLGANRIPGLGPAWYERYAARLARKLERKMEKDFNRGRPLGMDPEVAAAEIAARLQDLEERKYTDLLRDAGQLPFTLAMDPAVRHAALHLMRDGIRG